ncbi:MAG: LysR substrate-binding domain-containing protein [Comamonas sp.]
METKWLEDFVSLAETHSFSRSAQLRHVTQPAFSRRIQSLEAWAGTDLVDRSSYPTRLTPAGQTLYTQALELLHDLQATRSMLRAHRQAADDVITFAMPHSLTFAFFPAWMSTLREQFHPIKTRLIALNVLDAVTQLSEGGCDILVAFHHPARPLQLDPARYELIQLGTETLSAYSLADAQLQPVHTLDGRNARQPTPYLGYGPGAYLSAMAELIIQRAPTPLHLDRVYETDMAESVKAMALAGHGVAFLPRSLVKRELRNHRLVPASANPDLQVSMDILAYRERPTARSVPKRVADELWDYLLTPAAHKARLSQA